MSEITLVLQAVERGERSSEDLLPLVYDELRRIAASRMAQEDTGHTLQPTALVHEAWLELVGEGDRTWKNRAHFFGAAADAMRRILVHHARHKSRLKRGGGQVRVTLENLELPGPTPDEDVLRINDALEKLEQEDPEQARIVVLKFFGGLTNEEAAEHLGVSERTVYRQWVCAKARLGRFMRAPD